MMNTSPIDAASSPAQKLTVPKASKNHLSQNALLGYRLMIAYRFALALIGGYILAALAAMVIAQSFSEAPGSAAISATLIAFILQTAVFIWVFMVNKTIKATLGVVLPSCTLLVIYYFIGQ